MSNETKVMPDMLKLINNIFKAESMPKKKEYRITIEILGVGGDHLTTKPITIDIPMVFAEDPVVIIKSIREHDK